MKAITVSVNVDVQPERVKELVRICFDPALNTVQHWAKLVKGIPGEHWWELWVMVPRLVEDDSALYVLSPDTVETGLQKMADQSPEFFSNILNEEITVDTADVFLQYCLFGAIVFGKRFDIL